MLENSKINYYCNIFKLSIDILLDIYNNNPKKFFIIFKKIYLIHTGNKLNRPNLQHFLLFNPLPKYFKIKDHNGDYMNICDRYSFHGTHGNNILISNIVIPHYTLSTIPFFMQYKYNNKFKKITSNVFYYELTIDKKPFRSPWKDQSISIGYGKVTTQLKNNHVGWSANTIGYHSDDGKIFCENSINCVLPVYSYGDTVGAGIIYISKFEYKFFFTLNGKMLPFTRIAIIKERLSAMISIDHPASVLVNFGQRNFLYDFSQHITPIVINTSNTFIKNYFKLNMYCFESNLKYFTLYHKNIPKNKVNFSDSLLEPLIEPVESDSESSELSDDIISTNTDNLLINEDENELTNYLMDTQNLNETFIEYNNVAIELINKIKKEIQYLTDVKSS